jgi:hypothetical protein
MKVLNWLSVHTEQDGRLFRAAGHSGSPYQAQVDRAEDIAHFSVVFLLFPVQSDLVRARSSPEEDSLDQVEGRGLVEGLGRSSAPGTVPQSLAHNRYHHHKNRIHNRLDSRCTAAAGRAAGMPVEQVLQQRARRKGAAGLDIPPRKP